MKDKVKQMYDQITMPEDCVRRIRNAMAQQAGGRRFHPARPGFRPATVMAALLAVLLFASVAMNNQVQTAVRDFVKRYVFNGGRVVIETHEDGMSGVIYKPGMELYGAHRQDGRLYFVANGENRDITDEISMEKPFITTYVDEQGVEHQVIVGGTPDNYGIHEFYRDLSEDQPQWIGGIGENYLDMETEKAYPWLAAAWKELNIPWPMPGE